MQHLKKTFQEEKLRNFIKVNLERIINVAPLQKELGKEIQMRIYANLD